MGHEVRFGAPFPTLNSSWYGKMSIILFVLSLPANAVTSKRVGQDYMFHPGKKQLGRLVPEFRQSGFYKTSFLSQTTGKTGGGGGGQEKE